MAVFYDPFSIRGRLMPHRHAKSSAEADRIVEELVSLGRVVTSVTPYKNLLDIEWHLPKGFQHPPPPPIPAMHKSIKFDVDTNCPPFSKTKQEKLF